MTIRLLTILSGAILCLTPLPALAQQTELAAYERAVADLDATLAREPFNKPLVREKADSLKAARLAFDRAMAPYRDVEDFAAQTRRQIESSTAIWPIMRIRALSALDRDTKMFSPRVDEVRRNLDLTLAAVAAGNVMETNQQEILKLVAPGSEGGFGVLLDPVNQLLNEAATRDITGGKVDFGRLAQAAKIVRNGLEWGRAGMDSDPLASPDFDRFMALFDSADLVAEGAGSISPAMALRLMLQTQRMMLTEIGSSLRVLRGQAIKRQLDLLRYKAEQGDSDLGPEPERWGLRRDLPFHTLYIPFDVSLGVWVSFGERKTITTTEQYKLGWGHHAAVPEPVFTCLRQDRLGRTIADCTQAMRVETTGPAQGTIEFPPLKPGRYEVVWTDAPRDQDHMVLSRLAFEVRDGLLTIDTPADRVRPGGQPRASWKTGAGPREQVWLVVTPRGAASPLAFDARSIVSKTAVAPNGAVEPWPAPLRNGEYDLRLATLEQGAGLVTIDTQPFTVRDNILPTDLEGRWIAEGYDCDPPVSPQEVEIRYVRGGTKPDRTGTLEATKVAGDACINTGEVTWRGDLVGNQLKVEFHANAPGRDRALGVWQPSQIMVLSADELTGTAEGIRYRRK